MWDLSCRDWERRLREGRPLVPALPLFQEEADLATAFFDQIRLPDVPGTPLLAEAAGDWFRHGVVAPLFGSLDPATNIRHIRELFLLVGKGNSKTTYGAATMLTALLMNQRPRAEFLLVGPTQAISDLAFNQVVGMIEINHELKKRFHVRDHLKEIVDRLTKAKLKVKTFDLNILTGPRPAGVLIDELHLLGKHAATGKVLRQIRGGLEKMTEGFLLIITTQSDEAPAGAFREELHLAREIRDGRFAGRMLPVLYEFPEAVAQSQTEWQRPDLWSMVMPNLGRSLRLESLLQDWEQEKSKGAHAIRVWASQHLNVEIGVALKSDGWAGAEYWERQAEPDLTLSVLLACSEVVTVGIDGGGLDDLLGFSVMGRERGTGRWLSWNCAWAHPVVLKRRPGEAAKLRDFAALGELRIVERVGQDMDDLVGICAEVSAAGLLPEKHGIGIDPGNSHAVVDALTAAGFGGEQMAAVSQGWRLGGAIKLTERKLAEGSLVHAGQSLMAWCAGNAKVEPKGNAMLITKQASGSAKIDPLMATFNAVELMARAPVSIEPRVLFL